LKLLNGNLAGKEDKVISKHFWRGVLIVALSVALAKPAEAEGYPSGGAIVAAIVGVAAAVVVVAVLVIHKSSEKRTVTGCVNPGKNGMSVTDEKDRQLYALTGNTADIKPGDRMTLRGKKIKPKQASKTLVWETKTITKDLGACQP
jgi:hypothetical protein